MPNWAMGELQIRGEERDVLSFLTNGVENFKQGTRFGGGSKIEYSDCQCHIKGTDRCYVIDQTVHAVGVIDRSSGEEKELTTALMEVECAWDLDVPGFVNVSKEYRLDLCVSVDEPLMGFSHELYVEKGDVHSDIVQALESKEEDAE